MRQNQICTGQNIMPCIHDKLIENAKEKRISLWFINDEFGAKVVVKLTSAVVKEAMKVK